MSDFPIAYKPVASYMAGGTSDFETVPVGTLAKLERMREALVDCANDLESEIKARYAGTLDYPSMKAKFDRDMEPVIAARAALEATP